MITSAGIRKPFVMYTLMSTKDPLRLICMTLRERYTLGLFGKQHYPRYYRCTWYIMYCYADIWFALFFCNSSFRIFRTKSKRLIYYCRKVLEVYFHRHWSIIDSESNQFFAFLRVVYYSACSEVFFGSFFDEILAWNFIQAHEEKLLCRSFASFF